MPVTETVHDLPHHDRLTITTDVRPTGVVAFHICGPELHGTIVFRPDVHDDRAVPDRVIVQLGDGDHLLATHLTNLPVVYGITLTGGGKAIDVDTPSWPQQLRLTPPRAAGNPTPGTAAAIRYTVAVCELLAGRYRRLDRPALMRAAARHTAAARLKRLVHQQILPNHRMLTEIRDELTRAYQLATALQRLSPLPLLPAPAPCTVRLPHASPDTYVTADDDGAWLTCPTCHQPTVMITPGANLIGLLAGHAEHTCPPDPR